ncbi:acyl-CoA thioesterase [Pseudomonas syringae group genomosp. 3]|nr:acyl-CoA thioesterase [Pseudomonas syringae group genomosp. 3]
MISLSHLIKDFRSREPFTVPANWLQGRTVYGGLTTALSLEAVRQEIDIPLHHLRSVQAVFVSPSTQEQVFETTVLRKGKSVTTIAAECFSSEALALRTSMVFTAHRTTRIQHTYPQPPAAERPENITELARPHAPACIHNFEIRPVTGGALPFSGASFPQMIMWARHLDSEGVDPMVALIALADVLPPAAATVLTEPVPLSTISWAFDIINLPRNGEWFLLKSSSCQAGVGYSLQDMEIWSERGELILMGRQTVAIFA